jgi:hypothetical protein
VPDADGEGRRVAVHQAGPGTTLLAVPDDDFSQGSVRALVGDEAEWLAADGDRGREPAAPTRQVPVGGDPHHASLANSAT